MPTLRHDTQTSAYTATGGRLRRVPNQPKTPQHTIRVPDDVWERWAALAAPHSVSEVIREQMTLWERRETRKRRDGRRKGGQ